MSGLRYVDDPLVTVSGQFPLGRCDFSLPDHSEPPSGAVTRPFALRWLIDLGVPSTPRSYRYCSIRQVAVDVVTGAPRPPVCKLDWTTIATKDGDEGPSKDYGWETWNRWRDLGAPLWHEFGLTATPTDQHIWHLHPHHGPHWRLPIP